MSLKKHLDLFDETDEEVLVRALMRLENERRSREPRHSLFEEEPKRPLNKNREYSLLRSKPIEEIGYNEPIEEIGYNIPIPKEKTFLNIKENIKEKDWFTSTSGVRNPPDYDEKGFIEKPKKDLIQTIFPLENIFPPQIIYINEDLFPSKIDYSEEELFALGIKVAHRVSLTCSCGYHTSRSGYLRK